MSPKKQAPEIDTYTHKETQRINTPQAALAHYDDESDKTHAYSFDPHLSPSLEWAGKSENDSFTVPTISIYRHETVNPIKIINPALNANNQRQILLFSDVSPFERMQEKIRAIEAYQHHEDWKNRMIAGDSLIIMNSLLQKESMAGKIQMAYIDPPYGIKYGSNFQPFVNKRDVKDKSDSDLTQEPEMIKAFRDTWELGIHSYLSYLRNRLLLVRELLCDSGSVFVQISDENVHHVREICDEVFGPDNFVTMIKFQKTGNMVLSNLIASTTDYIIWYAKKKEQIKYHKLYLERKAGDPSLDRYDYVEFKDGTVMSISQLKKEGKENLLSSLRNFRYTTLISDGAISNSTESINFKGEKFYLPPGKHWTATIEGMKRLIAAGRVEKVGTSLRYKRYLDDFPVIEMGDLWKGVQIGVALKYVVQTSPVVIQRCMLMTTDPGDLVLDITCGSGTTAYVAEQWARRWITCDTSRVAIALARQRLMTANFDYYRLANPEIGISAGFVYKTVPHVTLKSIANNEPPSSEILYDQPEIDRAKLRMTSPFTVEALPAPVVISVDDAAKFSDDINDGAKQQNYREQLLATGIIGRKGERIRFSRVEVNPGTQCINAIAETDEEKKRRAAVCFAGESNLMDSRRVLKAFEEALSIKIDLLVFAAFQFDPEAANLIYNMKTSYKIEAVQVQMNPDLMTEDLKKNLRMDQSFWLVGQPDVEVLKVKGKKNHYRVKVHGFDYYDVNKNEMISGECDKIAMWLLDSDYNGMCLNPSQVFFPLEGRNGGWNKLAKTLRAEIDAELIEHYRGTLSLEFEAKPGQKIAVKIIDDRGIESLRVLDVREAE